MDRIFVIEDDAIMRDMLSMLLDRIEDLTVAGMAASGDEALEMWRSEDVDLTLLDLSLPGTPGLQVLEALKQRAPDSPVVVLSGSHRPEAVKEARAAGADGFVLKGDPQKIIAAIRDVLAGRGHFNTFEIG